MFNTDDSSVLKARLAQLNLTETRWLKLAYTTLHSLFGVKLRLCLCRFLDGQIRRQVVTTRPKTLTCYPDRGGAKLRRES
jgi:hypothetical protein